MKTAQVNPDLLSGDFRGCFHEHLRGTFRGGILTGKRAKWRRRYTPPIALQGVATPPSRFFPQFRGVFAEKGARFRGKWGSAPSAPPPPSPLLEDPPPHPLAPAPPFSWGAVGVLLKIPGALLKILGGGAEAPFTAKTSPFFGENALVSSVSQGCRSYTPSKGPCRTPSRTPMKDVAGNLDL